MTRSLLAVAALAVAVLAALPAHGPGRVELTAGEGALDLVNSREGRAILSAGNLEPGQEVSGAVTVANRGGASAHVSLHSSRAGGALGGALRVTIEDAAGRALARGTLADLAGCHDLGTMASREARTYRFTARLPREAGNAYMGSTTVADERWTVGGCQAAAEPERRPRLAISHRRVALVHGRVRIRVRCKGPSSERCTGSLALAGRSWRSRRIFVARARAARFAVATGRTVTLYAAVPPESRPALRRRHKAVALAVVRGPRGSTKRLLTLISGATR